MVLFRDDDDAGVERVELRPLRSRERRRVAWDTDSRGAVVVGGATVTGKGDGDRRLRSGSETTTIGSGGEDGGTTGVVAAAGRGESSAVGTAAAGCVSTTTTCTGNVFFCSSCRCVTMAFSPLLRRASINSTTPTTSNTVHIKAISTATASLIFSFLDAMRAEHETTDRVLEPTLPMGKYARRFSSCCVSGAHESPSTPRVCEWDASVQRGTW